MGMFASYAAKCATRRSTRWLREAPGTSRCPWPPCVRLAGLLCAVIWPPSLLQGWEDGRAAARRHHGARGCNMVQDPCSAPCCMLCSGLCWLGHATARTAAGPSAAAAGQSVAMHAVCARDEDSWAGTRGHRLLQLLYGKTPCHCSADDAAASRCSAQAQLSCQAVRLPACRHLRVGLGQPALCVPVEHLSPAAGCTGTDAVTCQP